MYMYRYVYVGMDIYIYIYINICIVCFSLSVRWHMYLYKDVYLRGCVCHISVRTYIELKRFLRKKGMKKRTVTSRLEIDFSVWLSTLPDPHFYKGTTALNVSAGTDKL